MLIFRLYIQIIMLTGCHKIYRPISYITKKGPYEANLSTGGTATDVTDMVRQEVIPSFSISPNPSSGVVNLSTIEDIQSVEVFDITGKLLQSIDQVTSPTVDLRAYVDGIYLLRVSDTQNRVSNIRVVKGE